MLVLLVPAPVRRTGFFAVRGHRVFGVPRAAVRAVDVVLDDRRFSARRDGGAWAIEGRRASAGTADARDRRTLVLGGLNAAGSAFYARREGDPRILQVGTLLLSEIERVFYTRDRKAGASDQRPEIG